MVLRHIMDIVYEVLCYYEETAKGSWPGSETKNNRDQPVHATVIVHSSQIIFEVDSVLITKLH